MTLKERYFAWYDNHIVKGFYKSYAWLASVLSLLVAYGPDVASFLLAHADLISSGLPTLPQHYKTALLLIAHGVVFFVRPLKQSNMPTPTQIVEVPVAPISVVPGAPWPPAMPQKGDAP